MLFPISTTLKRVINHMELRQLAYFHAVARYSSFTKAAEELHVSQPAITTAVKNLEDELLVKLFVRDKRKVMLTYEGQLFLQRTLPLLEQLNQAVHDVQKMSSDYDHILNIGLTPVNGARLAVDLYGGFSDIYPDIRFQLLEMGSFGILDAIDRNEIDIGYMVILDQARRDYDTCVIEKGVIRAVMHRQHPLASQAAVTVDQLKDVPIIALPSHTFLAKKIDEAFARQGLKPRVIATPQQMFTVFNLIRRNVAVSFTLGDTFASIVQADELVSIPLDPPIPFEIGFVWKHNRRLNSAARSCIAYAKDRLTVPPDTPTGKP